MPYASAVSACLLVLSCLLCAIAVGRARRHYGEADQPALFCALLGFALPGAAAAAAAVRFGLDAQWQAAHLWLSQASVFLALPLLGAAALALGRSWAWSRPNWGRVILGLCAFFELFRQLDRLEDYRLLLNLASLLLILYAGVVQWPRRAAPLAAAGASGLLLLAGWQLGGGGSGDPQAQTPWVHLLLAAAYPLLAWLILLLPGGRPVEKPANTL